MPCIVEQRQQAREAIADLDAHPRAVDTSLIAPDADPRNSWTVQIVVEGDGVPAGVLTLVAEHGLTTLRVERPTIDHAVLTAEVPRR